MTFKKIPRSKLAVCLLLIYLGIIEVEGVLRWLLSKVGAESLIYVRDLLPPLGIWLALRGTHDGRRNLLFVIVALQLGLASAVGYYFSGNLAQVMFSLRMLVPFIFGIGIYSVVTEHWSYFGRGCLVLLGIGVIGVMLNQYIQFPWIGADFTVFNVTMELSREWMEVGGRERLPGFSRASYDAAIQISIFAVIALYYVRHNLLRIAIAGVSIYAVSITTSKTSLACQIQVVANYAIIELLPRLTGGGVVSSLIRRWGIAALRLQTAIFAIGCVLLPLQSTTTLKYVEGDLHEDSSFHLLSFQDRVANFWPLAYDYIQHKGSPLLGVGLGGMGTPLEMFGKAEMAMPADNSFLYMYGLFGVFIYLYFGAFILVCFSKRLMSPSKPIVFGLLALSAASGGVTKTIIEGAFDTLFLGLVIAHVTFGWKGNARRPGLTPAKEISQSESPLPASSTLTVV